MWAVWVCGACWASARRYLLRFISLLVVRRPRPGRSSWFGVGGIAFGSPAGVVGGLRVGLFGLVGEMGVASDLILEGGS